MKSLLSKKSSIRVFAILSLTVSLAACGMKNNNNTTLPDDPSQEGQNIPSTGVPAPAVVPAPSVPISQDLTTQEAILQSYSYVDPNHLIPDKHLKAALLYYDTNKTNIANTAYLSVIDFSQYSGNKRFFIIDMKTGSVWAIHTAHGSGSDRSHTGYATSFSNVSGSNATSLGVYKTAETYSGNHGLTLRLDGLSSTNSNARDRAIVLHGADYVAEANVNEGRSWGCPAIAMENRDKVVNMLKGGSIIYAGYK